MTGDSQFTDNPWETKKEPGVRASDLMEESLAEFNLASTSSVTEPYNNLLSKGDSRAASQDFYNYSSYTADFGIDGSLSATQQTAITYKSAATTTDPWNTHSNLKMESPRAMSTPANDTAKKSTSEPIDTIKLSTFNEKTMFGHVIYEIFSFVLMFNKSDILALFCVDIPIFCGCKICF